MSAARAVLSLLVAALAAGCAATHKHDAAKPIDRNAMWRKSLARAPTAATAAFDARGRLWLATVEDGHVVLRHSNDMGKTFSVLVRVNPASERIAADGENRPKLAFGKHGEVYVSWTQSLDVPFAGHVRFAYSRDGGATFSPPVTVNDDRAPISHRFDSLIVDGKRKYVPMADGESVLDAQHVPERERHAAASCAAGEHERAVHVEEHQAR